jgi:protein-S-isoprenylcysteine O-methyltransferase Ste14
MPKSESSLERRKVGMLIPPPIVLIVLLIFGIALHALGYGRYERLAPVAAIGALFVLASVSLLAWSVRFFKRAGTPVRPVAPATAVVTDGPYRFSRNPMYVGMAGILIGAGMLAANWSFFAAAAVFVLVVHFGAVLPEERYMESLHGEAYQSLKAKVRRWL